MIKKLTDKALDKLDEFISGDGLVGCYVIGSIIFGFIWLGYQIATTPTIFN